MGDVTIIDSKNDNYVYQRLIKANKLLSIAGFAIALATATFFGLSFLPFNTIANVYVIRFFLVTIIILHSAAIIYSCCVHFKKKHLRDINMFILLFDLFVASLTFANYNFYSFVPVILSICYLDFKYSLGVGVASLLLLVLADCLTHYYIIGTISYDLICFNKPIEIIPGYDYSRAELIPYINRLDTLKVYATEFLPSKVLCFVFILVIFAFFARFARTLVQNHSKSLEKEATLTYELTAASNIQNSMLPINFDEINQDLRLKVIAKAYPAKEVGGDFYDFFKIDDDHFALVIADVSGKGFPAALFMARSKTLIKDQLLINHSPKKTLTEVNKMLCNNNSGHIFVTAWLGILDLRNGKLTYVNAGHNYPVIINANKNTIFLKNKPQCFLAAFETTTYNQNEIILNNGDIIFLYTDGITEANNKKFELFGNDRLLKTTSECDNNDVKACLNYVKNKVDDFAMGAEQFDDITVLVVKYNGIDEDIASKKENA